MSVWTFSKQMKTISSPHRPAISWESSRWPAHWRSVVFPSMNSCEINIEVDDELHITLLFWIASHKPATLRQLPKLMTVVSFSTMKLDSIKFTVIKIFTPPGIPVSTFTQGLLRCTWQENCISLHSCISAFSEFLWWDKGFHESSVSHTLTRYTFFSSFIYWKIWRNCMVIKLRNMHDGDD